MTRLYLSGEMSGIPEHNFPAFRAATAKLREAGYEVADPSENGEIVGWTWADYLRVDLKLVLECDGIATLGGWQRSAGARLECEVAQKLDIPVRPVERWIEAAVLEECPRPMTLDELRRHALENSMRWFPGLHARGELSFMIQSALGLAGETGEAVDVIKKWHRHGGLNELNRAQLGAEMADVFVYLLHLCTAAGIDLEDEYFRKAAENETRFGKAQPVTQGG